MLALIQPRRRHSEMFSRHGSHEREDRIVVQRAEPRQTGAQVVSPTGDDEASLVVAKGTAGGDREVGVRRCHASNALHEEILHL